MPELADKPLSDKNVSVESTNDTLSTVDKNLSTEQTRGINKSGRPWKPVKER